jgi:hypothetical protein
MTTAMVNFWPQSTRCNEGLEMKIRKSRESVFVGLGFQLPGLEIDGQLG